MDILKELQKSGLNISPVTSNAINKHGLGDISFKSASIKYPDSLTMNFLVESSHGKGNETHFSGNGDELAFSSGYKVIIQFINFGKYAPTNFLSLPLSQQIIYIKDIFDKADIKVSCDCGAFYWQGTSELLDRRPPDANYTGFTGQFGKGIWDTIHNTKNRICKHIYHVLENLESYIPRIIKDLNKGTSVSGSTAQNTILVAPQKPAGIPKKPEETTKTDIISTINSEKAENTVKKDIDEVQSTSDQLDLPTMDTTKVKAQSHEDESDVISGAEKSEPPIEDITLKKDAKNEDLDDDLPTMRETKLQELEIKSPEDYELSKEYYESDAYLVITFEQFKNYKKKVKTKKLKNDLLQEKLIPTYDIPNETMDWLENNKPSMERYMAIKGKTGLPIYFNKPYIESLESEMGGNNSKLIVDSNNTPIAFLSWEVGWCPNEEFQKEINDYFDINIELDLNSGDDQQYIQELHLFSFDDNPKMIIVSDTCKALDSCLKKYPVISWSVHDNNPAKEMYDKMVPKFNGFIKNKKDGFDMTGYILIRGISKIPPMYLREESKYSLEKFCNDYDYLSEMVINSWEYQHLTELKKRDIAKMLALAGLITFGAGNLLRTEKADASVMNSYPEWVYEEVEEKEPEIQEKYQYQNERIGNIIEKYRGDFDPSLIETFLYAESKIGEHVKYDKYGAGIAQVSQVLVKDYNERNGTNYSHKDTFTNDDLNIKIAIWYLDFCRERYIANKGENPDDIDLYLMYNNGVRGYLRNMSNFRNVNFRPYQNYIEAKKFIANG
jgi:hypothetical protein